MDIGQTLSGRILHPYIVVGGLLVAQLAYDDTVLHGDGVGHAGHHFRQGDCLVGGRCPGAIGEVGFQLHLAGHHRIIGEVFRRIVGDRLHRGLPGKEILREEVRGTVGQSVHTATNHAEGDLGRINYRGEGAHQLGLLVRRGDILEVERQPTVYDVPQVYLGHAADARVVGLRQNLLRPLFQDEGELRVGADAEALDVPAQGQGVGLLDDGHNLYK